MQRGLQTARGVAEPFFLSLEEVLAIHEDQIRIYGGSARVRDLGLLQFALGAVQAKFGGAYLHQTLFEMAAAYLFHICSNHPFLDGNKRTALASALAFLHLNDVAIDSPPDELYELVIGVADGSVSKAEVAVFFQQHAD